MSELSDEELKNAYHVPCIYQLLNKNTGADTQDRQYGQPLCSDQTSAIIQNGQPLLRIRVPGSKSITNRALLLAALADGTSHLHGMLFSDDSRCLLACLSDLGFDVKTNEEELTSEITGLGGQIPDDGVSLYVGSAGTAARFLTALLGSKAGTWRLDSSEQMRRRPMAPLLDALKDLGAEFSFEEKEECFPFTVTGHGFCKKKLTVNIDQSSQFLSALLIAAGSADENIEIQVEGSHGMSYIDITARMMEQFGVHTQKKTAEGSPSRLKYFTGKGQSYRSLDYNIEPDVSAACYFYAMAPLLGISVMAEGVHLSSMQGDIQFLRLMEELGCSLKDCSDGIILSGPQGGQYPGISADMREFSDQAITLAAIAPFASGPTTITGIGHIRLQESDRISGIVTELSRMGIHCEENDDSVTIWPGCPQPCSVRTRDDHRMAMGFTLTGLRAPGIAILNPECCRKTFENYFQVMDQAVRSLIRG